MLGANINNVIRILIFDFTKWVIVANIIAYPIAYFAMNNWLNNFAYHTDINFLNFIWATLIAFAITLITVCYQAIRAANDNPVNSIKYE